MDEEPPLGERELKLTAALYTCLGAAKYVRETGRLPEAIGGARSHIPMSLILRGRGRDITLTPDEQLVHEAILREGRLPGGAVRLTSEAGDATQQPDDPSEG